MDHFGRTSMVFGEEDENANVATCSYAATTASPHPSPGTETEALPWPDSAPGSLENIADCQDANSGTPVLPENQEWFEDVTDTALWEDTNCDRIKSVLIERGAAVFLNRRSNYPASARDRTIGGEFRYHVCQYEEVVSLGDHTGFEATLRLDVHTVEQVKEWVQKLKGSSGVTWRVDVTRPRLGKRVLFKASYKCQHRVNPRAAKSSKNTCCQAKMHTTLKSTRGEMKTEDPHMPDLPFKVILINRHNHNLFVADAIRHRDVGEKANNILTGLFEIGHTPTSALAVLKHDLQMEYGQRYVYVSANREFAPTCLMYRSGLFHKVCREEYGTQTGPTMLAALKLQVEIYNNKCNDTCALLGTTSQGAPLVVVCSPLMKKVHQLKHSGELCFIDSSGRTAGCAGGLPLGILLCQSEDEQTIAQGLEQLKQVVGEKGFAGRGHEGPQLVITDDCRAERGALRKAFPKATLLLCSFHLLQAVWRWLWSKESGVTHGDRPALFAIVKEMLYCQEIGSVDRLYSEARGHPVAASYEKFLRYLDRLYARRECWALSYRGSFLTRGNNTNNFAEAAMRVLKDKILQRTKAFNLPQLFDLLTSRLETYYEARIVDVALGRWESFQRAKFLPKMATLQHRIFSRLRTRSLW
ncbi:Transposase [Dissostichus eleginoides]|uniref:Transposase n=1 Tax=Dissostichus eleginoides TaxID=100907 RepID=A0AAD9FAM2_DISEL|nr:Transposase [Dissostichus eleginoides]